jgi:flagellar biosynthesis/type III secretory pathway M-ring protein FliF/YscJ
MGSSDGREDFHMSTALIVVIVVAAVILLALLVMLPRMRATARQKKAERELHSRRSAAAEEHRGIAAERESRAEIAEQQARMAEQAAQRERAEAGLQSERAEMHERGMADEELIDETERDRFKGVTERDDRARSGTDTPEERRFDRDRITDDIRESDRPRR